VASSGLGTQVLVGVKLLLISKRLSVVVNTYFLNFFPTYLPRAIFYAICAHLGSISSRREVPNPQFSFDPAHYPVCKDASRFETTLFFRPCDVLSPGIAAYFKKFDG